MLWMIDNDSILIFHTSRAHWIQNPGPVPSKGMQTSLSFAPVLPKDVQCAESNEKLVFQFLLFKLS